MTNLGQDSTRNHVLVMIRVLVSRLPSYLSQLILWSRDVSRNVIWFALSISFVFDQVRSFTRPHLSSSFVCNSITYLSLAIIAIRDTASLHYRYPGMCVDLFSTRFQFHLFLSPLVWSSLSRHRRQGFFRVIESRRNCTYAVVHTNVVHMRCNGCRLQVTAVPLCFKIFGSMARKNRLKKQQHVTSSCAHYNTQLGMDRRLWVEKNEPIGSLT
jgi:hypothetical protein